MQASFGLQRKIRLAGVTFGVMAAVLSAYPAMAQQGTVAPKDTANKGVPKSPAPKAAVKPGTGKVAPVPGASSVSAKPGPAKVGVKSGGTTPDSSKGMKAVGTKSDSTKAGMKPIGAKPDSAKAAKVDCAEIQRVIQKAAMEKMSKGQGDGGSLELNMEELSIKPADIGKCFGNSTP